MKKIGVIVAMREEKEKIVNIMDNKEIKNINELHFIEGKIQKKEIILVQSGVGKVNAARVTQIMIDNFKVESIINLGSAGALDPMLEIGDVVIGEKLLQHDFDITAFGHAKGYITGVGDVVYCDSKLVKEIKQAIKNLNERTYKIKTGVIASGDIFCTDISMKEKIHAKFDADCVEMEGAAIAQVCYLDNIPFVVIRSISDTPNEKNSIIFEQFLELASERCANVLREFCKID